MNGPGFNGRPAIALDGGTTTTRARLVDRGRVIAVATRPVGVRDAFGTGGKAPLIEAVRACLGELGISAPIVAAGMLSSEVGLAAVPHVEAPAGLSELARGARSTVVMGVSDAPILFVPGVRTPTGEGPDGWTRADVMRGEESETIGARIDLGLTGPSAFLWPGSHSKLVGVDEAGRIVASYTTLAGEITATIAAQTLIARSLPETLPDRPNPEAVALGMRVATAEGLGRAAFLVRVADLTGALDALGRASFWIGATIADDARQLARNPIVSGASCLWVGGREPQRSLYTARLSELIAAPVKTLDDERAGRASALGALAVAEAAEWPGLIRR